MKDFYKSNHVYQLLAAILIWAHADSALSDESVISKPLINESSITFPEWELFTNEFGFSEQFPSVNIYNLTGDCIVQFEPTLGWSSEEIQLPENIVSDGSCDHFIPDGFGSSTPRQSKHWVVRLNTLGYDFCQACTHVENDLRLMLEKYPETWELEIVRIVAPEPSTQNSNN